MTNDHKHCVFCGEVVTGHVTNICHSPQNPYPPDTVGNKHHCVLVSNGERAAEKVRMKSKCDTTPILNEQPAPSPSESPREWLDKQLANPRSLPNDAWIAAETEFEGCVILLEKFTESLERENATLRQIVGELAKQFPLGCPLCGNWQHGKNIGVHEETCLIRRAQEAIKP